MFETDMEYLRKKEEMYKRRGLRIDNKDIVYVLFIILKEKYRVLKILFFVVVFLSIFYSFVIGFALGRG